MHECIHVIKLIGKINPLGETELKMSQSFWWLLIFHLQNKTKIFDKCVYAYYLNVFLYITKGDIKK